MVHFICKEAKKPVNTHGNIDRTAFTARVLPTKLPMSCRLCNLIPQELRQRKASDRTKLLSSLHLKYSIDKQSQLYILGQDGLEVNCVNFIG